MEDTLQRIEQKIDTMQGELTAVKGSPTAVETRLGTVETHLGTAEGSLSGLHEMVHQQGLRHEYLIDKVTITMEGVQGVRQVLDEHVVEVLKQLDQRVQPVELATRYLATTKTKPR